MWFCTVDIQRDNRAQSFVVRLLSPHNGFPNHVVRQPALSSNSSCRSSVADRIENHLPGSVMLLIFQHSSASAEVQF